MDRRESLKALALTGLSTGLIAEACKTEDKKTIAVAADKGAGYDRLEEEKEHYKTITSATFFTKEEMQTITVLSDIIIPADEVSGGAIDAKVPEFIEFIVKDKPEHQIPMRGGLRWLNVQSLKRFDKTFVDSSDKQRIELVDEIAYPDKAKPGMMQGVAFFNLMRNLTASGFYSSEIGVKDMGFKGNTPNQWNGVPADVLKQYNLAYTEKELKECISF
jgi:hypothetical protein